VGARGKNSPEENSGRWFIVKKNENVRCETVDETKKRKKKEERRKK